MTDEDQTLESINDNFQSNNVENNPTEDQEKNNGIIPRQYILKSRKIIKIRKIQYNNENKTIDEDNGKSKKRKRLLVKRKRAINRVKKDAKKVISRASSAILRRQLLDIKSKKYNNMSQEKLLIDQAAEIGINLVDDAAKKANQTISFANTAIIIADKILIPPEKTLKLINKRLKRANQLASVASSVPDDTNTANNKNEVTKAFEDETTKKVNDKHRYTLKAAKPSNISKPTILFHNPLKERPQYNIKDDRLLIDNINNTSKANQSNNLNNHQSTNKTKNSHTKKVLKIVAKKGIKYTLKMVRLGAETTGRTLSSSFESVSDDAIKSGIAPAKSVIELSGALMRPKSLHKKTLAISTGNFKSALSEDAKDAITPMPKGLSTAKTTGRTAMKTGKTVKNTVKLAKRAGKVVVGTGKAIIGIAKLTKIATLAIKLIKVTVKIAVKATLLVIKALKAIVAAIITVKAILVIAIVAFVALIILLVFVIVVEFTPNIEDGVDEYGNPISSSEIMLEHMYFIRSLDDEINNYIAGYVHRNEELSEDDENFIDDLIFLNHTEITTNLRQFIAIFMVWQENTWTDAEGNAPHNFFRRLHEAQFELTIAEEIYYTLEIGEEEICEVVGYDDYEDPVYECATNEIEILRERLRIFIDLYIRNLADILQYLDNSIGTQLSIEIEWILEIYENLDLDEFEGIDEFLGIWRFEEGCVPDTYCTLIVFTV